MLDGSMNPSLLLLLYEPQALPDMVLPALTDRFTPRDFRVPVCEKSLVVRIPFTAPEVKSSGMAGFIVCEAVEGGMFLSAGLAHGSVDGSPPNESCLIFLF